MNYIVFAGFLIINLAISCGIHTHNNNQKLLTINNGETIPKVIWTIWSGDKMPESTQMVIDQWEKQAGEGWKVNVVSLDPKHPNYIEKYLKLGEDLPDFFLDDKIVNAKVKGFTWSALMRSDMFRFAILRKYGGIYLDAGTFINDEMKDVSLIKKLLADKTKEVAGYAYHEGSIENVKKRGFPETNILISKKKSKWVEQTHRNMMDFWNTWEPHNGFGEVDVLKHPIFNDPNVQSKIKEIYPDKSMRNYLVPYSLAWLAQYNNPEIKKTIELESVKGKYGGPLALSDMLPVNVALNIEGYRDQIGPFLNRHGKDLDDMENYLRNSSFLKITGGVRKGITDFWPNQDSIYSSDNIFRRLLSNSNAKVGHVKTLPFNDIEKLRRADFKWVDKVKLKRAKMKRNLIILGVGAAVAAIGGYWYYKNHVEGKVVEQDELSDDITSSTLEDVVN